MSESEETARAALADLSGRLAEARRRLREGDEPGLNGLAAAIEALVGLLGELPEATRSRLRAELVALLDEAGGLIDNLQLEHARLGERLRTSGSHRHANLAYRRAGGGGR